MRKLLLTTLTLLGLLTVMPMEAKIAVKRQSTGLSNRDDDLKLLQGTTRYGFCLCGAKSATITGDANGTTHLYVYDDDAKKEVEITDEDLKNVYDDVPEEVATYMSEHGVTVAEAIAALANQKNAYAALVCDKNTFLKRATIYLGTPEEWNSDSTAVVESTRSTAVNTTLKMTGGEVAGIIASGLMYPTISGYGSRKAADFDYGMANIYISGGTISYVAPSVYATKGFKGNVNIYMQNCTYDGVLIPNFTDTLCTASIVTSGVTYTKDKGVLSCDSTSEYYSHAAYNALQNKSGKTITCFGKDATPISLPSDIQPINCDTLIIKAGSSLSALTDINTKNITIERPESAPELYTLFIGEGKTVTTESMYVSYPAMVCNRGTVIVKCNKFQYYSGSWIESYPGLPYVNPETDEETPTTIYCNPAHLIHSENIEITEAVAPGCTTAGNSKMYYCPDCYCYFSDEELTEQTSESESYLAPTGHHYESGSNKCINCGSDANVYRPVTSPSQINAGCDYIMVGHIGSQYYTLSSPKKMKYLSDQMAEMTNGYGWDNEMTPVAVTRNDDGSITAAENNILEFTLVRPDGMNTSVCAFDSPWGIVFDTGNPIYAYNDLRFKGEDRYFMLPEYMWRTVDLVDEDFKIFTEDRNYDLSGLQLPQNVKDLTFEKNDVVMTNLYAAAYDNLLTYVLAKENRNGKDSVFISVITNIYDLNESHNSKASLYPTTLYYCASKAMAHLDEETSDLTIYGDNLDKEDIEEAISGIEEEGKKVTNLDFSEMAECKLTAEDIHEIINNHSTVLGKNTLTILPSGSTVSGSNIIVDGKCESLDIADGSNLTIPSRFFEELNSLIAAKAAYKRALSSTSVWGTLYLPFEIKSNEDIQLYKVSSIGTDEETYESYISFEPVDKVDASTPCAFKRKNSTTDVDLSSNNVKITSVGTPQSLSFYGVDINMLGTLKDTTIICDFTNNIFNYFIAQNKFWYAQVETIIPAFRAYIEMKPSASSPAKSLNILAVEDGKTTSILKIGDDGELEEVGKAEIYSLDGQQLCTPRKGKVNIINGKKVMIK